MKINSCDKIPRFYIQFCDKILNFLGMFCDIILFFSVSAPYLHTIDKTTNIKPNTIEPEQSNDSVDVSFIIPLTTLVNI